MRAARKSGMSVKIKTVIPGNAFRIATLHLVVERVPAPGSPFKGDIIKVLKFNFLIIYFRFISTQRAHRRTVEH